jgi:hypothetical protein
MRFKTLIALAVLIVSVALIEAQKKPDGVSSVRHTEQKLDAALSANDIAAIEQIVAAGYIEINAQGETSNKAQVLSDARARRSAIGIVAGLERTVSEQTIRLYGNTAIALCMITTKTFVEYQTSGPTSSHPPQSIDQERRTRVYSRDGAGWQLVAQQTTAIPKR